MNGILKEQISDLIKGRRVVIAIDGMCASGKSSLACDIQSTFGGTVIHADSFFLPFELRSEERLSQPGGNFHYERFDKEVISKLSDTSPFTYGVFDCSCGEINQSVTVDESSLIIIEGSYCMHPNLHAPYDLRIFCLTNERTQLERIIKRNGVEALQMFEQKWIPYENRYFSLFQIKNKCDVTVVT